VTQYRTEGEESVEVSGYVNYLNTVLVFWFYSSKIHETFVDHAAAGVP
jgi:hypothetical protein